MSNMEIGEKYFKIWNNEHAYGGLTVNFFGDVFQILKSEFEGYYKDEGECVIKHIKCINTGSVSDCKIISILGTSEYGKTYYELKNFIEERSDNSGHMLSFIDNDFGTPLWNGCRNIKLWDSYIAHDGFIDQDIDEDRIKRIFFPSWTYTNLERLSDLITAYFHYCYRHELKLIKCHHCGIWFATDDSRNKYCENRKSPYDENCSCKEAVANHCNKMIQQSRRIKKRYLSNGKIAKTSVREGDCFNLEDFVRGYDTVNDLPPTPENFKTQDEYMQKYIHTNKRGNANAQ